MQSRRRLSSLLNVPGVAFGRGAEKAQAASARAAARLGAAAGEVRWDMGGLRRFARWQLQPLIEEAVDSGDDSPLDSAMRGSAVNTCCFRMKSCRRKAFSTKM